MKKGKGLLASMLMALSLMSYQAAQAERLVEAQY